MLWAGSKARDIYLGTRAAAMPDGTDAALPVTVEGFEAGLSWAQGQLAESGYRGRLRVWLSGGLCRPFLLPALPGISGAAETLRVASKLANERTGLPGECRVLLDSPRRGEPSVAIAVAQETLDHLQSDLGNRCRIESIQPWWAEVLRFTLLRKDAPVALGVQDCDSLTVLIGRKNAFEVATTVNPVLDAASADSAFARALVSANVEQGQEMLGRMVLGRPNSDRQSECAFGTLLELSR